MTVTEAIDQLAQFTDNVSASDSNNELRRERILNYLIEVCQEIRERDYWFTLGQDFLSVAAGDSAVPVPDGCLSVTASGCGVFYAATGEELDYIDPVELQQLQVIPGFTTDNPEVFSIYEMDTDGTAMLQVPNAAAGYGLIVFFKAELPTLDEAASSGLNNLRLAVPSRWHQRVVIPGVRAKMKRQRGAKDWKDDEAEYQGGLKQLRREEKQGRSGLRQIPAMF